MAGVAVDLDADDDRDVVGANDWGVSALLNSGSGTLGLQHRRRADVRRACPEAPRREEQPYELLAVVPPGPVLELSQRLDTTNERLERLGKRQTETEVRLSSELTAVVGAVRELSDILREDRKLRTQVSDHEARIAALERRTG